jgi:hypothetical protein
MLKKSINLDKILQKLMEEHGLKEKTDEERQFQSSLHWTNSILNNSGHLLANIENHSQQGTHLGKN